VARRDLGVDRKIELAQMAALPPFAQVIADVKRLGSFGSRSGNMSVHGRKPSTRISCLPLPPT
jgi:hypothetical protein